MKSLSAKTSSANTSEQDKVIELSETEKAAAEAVDKLYARKNRDGDAGDNAEVPSILEQMQAASEAAKSVERARKEAERKRDDATFGAGLAEAMRANRRRQKACEAEVVKLKAHGNAAFKAGNHSEAREFYSKAIKKCKDASLGSGWYEDEAVLYCNRALMALHVGDAKDAEEDAKRTIELRPSWAKGHVRCALALRAQKLDKEAQRCFEKGAKLVSAKEKPLLENEYKKIYPQAYEIYAMPVIGGFQGKENNQQQQEEMQTSKGGSKQQDNPDARWEIPEAQRIANTLKDGMWANEKLQQRIMNNPILAKGMADPRSSALFQRIQENPSAAMKEYGTSPEARAFIEELMKTLGEHFMKEGEERAKRDFQAAIQGTAPAIMTKEEAETQRRVQKILARDDLREIMLDPETQKVLQECVLSPENVSKYMADNKWRTRLNLLLDNGLIRFE